MTKEERLNARWQKLCADIAELARERGAREPFIFACESGLCVLDGPAFDQDENARERDVLFVLPKPPLTVAAFDSGGW